MRNLFFYLLLSMLMATTTSFAQTKAEQDVAAAVKTLTQGMIDADTAKLSQLIENKLSYGHSSGKIQTKAELLHSLSSGESDFVTINLTDQTITVAGSTALVRHTLSATTNDGGKPGSVKLYILLVWQKVKGQWLLLGRQAVKAV